MNILTKTKLAVVACIFGLFFLSVNAQSNTVPAFSANQENQVYNADLMRGYINSPITGPAVNNLVQQRNVQKSSAQKRSPAAYSAIQKPVYKKLLVKNKLVNGRILYARNTSGINNQSANLSVNQTQNSTLIRPTCGNGVCENDPLIFSPPESVYSCPRDCPVVCTVPIPGNWTNQTPISPNTTNSSYPQPCCGNGICETSSIFGPETIGSCPSDCRPKCADRRDNDGDSRIDSADPGCHDRGILGTPYLPARDCELEPFVCGDFNKDGRVSTTDSLMIGRYLSGLYFPTLQQRNCGDVNSDGRVNQVDASLISRKSSGIWTVILRCPAACTRNSC